ncbi:MAG: hypothetical protein GY699_25275 [Desulfobacteraceae bacterium]|nr:hypothetical protein [Desulfobacteraceae bacterium]
MAYIYLLNLYEKIDLRLDEANALKTKGKKTPDEKRMLDGKIDILLEFKEFLSDNLNRKLPKRIRKRLLKPDE